MQHNIPTDHPRYKSLMARNLVEAGVKKGVTTPTGLVAQGRGEAFDYLLGEKSHDFSYAACRVAAAYILNAKKAVISINGNTAVLVPDEFVSLANVSGALLEINIFHDAPERREMMAEIFKSRGVDVLGVRPDAKIQGLTSDRAKVDSRGMYDADVVLVSLEDGDRTDALIKGGKIVIAIDLNPLSRTPRASHVPIIDNVQRAIPLIEQAVVELKSMAATDLSKIISEFDKDSILKRSESAIRGLNS